MHCFNVEEIAKDYLEYYLNVFLEDDVVDVRRLESNLCRDSDFYKYMPFGLMDEICKQLLEGDCGLVNIEYYVNRRD